MFQEEIMKKLLSLLLASIMLFPLCFSAVADENDDPTTYLSIINNDYDSVIMTFNVNADKFVADTATYRVFPMSALKTLFPTRAGLLLLTFISMTKAANTSLTATGQALSSPRAKTANGTTMSSRSALPIIKAFLMQPLQ